MKVEDRIIFVSSEWIVDKLLEDGQVKLRSTSKNLPSRIIRGKDVKHCRLSKDIAAKKIRFAV